MIWPYGLAVFGIACAVAIVAGLALFIRQVSRDGWNK